MNELSKIRRAAKYAARDLIGAATFVAVLGACGLGGCTGEPVGPDNTDAGPGAEDGGEAVTHCKDTHAIHGSVGGVDADAPDYKPSATWFNTSLEELGIDALDKEAMKQVGLDPDDDEDARRYKYFIKAFDLRLLNTEIDKDFKTHRDLGVYFFDLEQNAVQPGDEIEVFDVSAIEAPRNAGHKKVLGETLRVLIDEMRSNGKADAVVAFSPDRSREGLRNFLVNLLATRSRFATTGTATFDDMSMASKPVKTLKYPLASAGWVAIHVDATFGKDALSIEVPCIDYGLSTD